MPDIMCSYVLSMCFLRRLPAFEATYVPSSLHDIQYLMTEKE